MNSPLEAVGENELMNTMLMVLYHVGAIGIKLRKNESFSFSHKYQPVVSIS